MDNEDFIRRLGKESRRAAWFSVLGLVIVLLAFGYSIYSLQRIKEQKQAELNDLDRKISEFHQRVKELDEQIREKNEQVQAAVKARDYAVNPDLAKQADVVHSSEPPVIYFHITNEAQRAKAQDIANALQKAGYIVPGIQKVSIDLTKTDIRYFHPEDAGKAQDIGVALQKLGIADTRPRLIPGFVNKVPPGQYEVWFSNYFQ